ncbi:MAG: Gfo/Idh/MocA family oxidoreductase [Verrucomicrobiota bacterium]
MLYVGMNQRFTADSQKIKQLVEQGVLGDIYHAKAYWMRRTGIPKLGTWFGNREVAGGGCLYDIGVHMLDLCLYTMNNFEPVSVFGATYTKFGNPRPRRRRLGSFRPRRGALRRGRLRHGADPVSPTARPFHLDASWACHQPAGNRDGVEFFGTEGGASIRPARLYRGSARSARHVRDRRRAQDRAEDARTRSASTISSTTSAARKTPASPRTRRWSCRRFSTGIAESSRTGREVRPGLKAVANPPFSPQTKG